MTKQELEKKRDQITGWIEMLNYLPDESESGKIRDYFWKGS